MKIIVAVLLFFQLCLIGLCTAVAMNPEASPGIVGINVACIVCNILFGAVNVRTLVS